MGISRNRKIGNFLTLAICAISSGALLSAPSDSAFKVNGKVVTMGEVEQEQKGEFYEIDKRKFDIVERMAHERYLAEFWSKKAAEGKTSVEAAKQTYFDKNVKVSNSEVNDMISKYKDNPQFKVLSKDDQQKQVREFLKANGARKSEGEIIAKAVKKGELTIDFPQPKEPVYDIKLGETDVTRFGPNNDDIKPMGCDKNKCPITIVEYSEFQCPYCSRVIPTTKRILTEYKGRITWTTRDFPLNFHDRARPASIAAHCAADQGKYWHMYAELFANQGALDDESLKKYAAKSVKDKAKWEECFKNPGIKNQLIDANIDSGMKVGVTGTPAFFINGRRISGAQPYEEFKRIIDEELAKSKKS
jgi:protein-disulfide isomerase